MTPTGQDMGRQLFAGILLTRYSSWIFWVIFTAKTSVTPIGYQAWLQSNLIEQTLICRDN